MKQKIVGIALLLAFVLPVCAAFLYLHLQKRQIRREVKWSMIAGMDEQELVRIAVAVKDSASVLHWEHSKEFEYHGEMYDVVKRSYRGDSIFYICWWDNEETQCNKRLQKLAAYFYGQRQDSQQTRDQVSHFMKSLYLSNPHFSDRNMVVAPLIRSMPTTSFYSDSWQKRLFDPPDSIALSA